MKIANFTICDEKQLPYAAHGITADVGKKKLSTWQTATKRLQFSYPLRAMKLDSPLSQFPSGFC